MAKKTKKKTVKKAAKKAVKKAAPARKTKAKVTIAKAKAKPKTRRKAPSVGDRISSAYHAVVDSVTGTDRLRNKMEKTGDTESE